ncbi:MAG: aconitase X catalytic domain-containing protein [Alphaproteobacteria bacterium]|nr:aconitase X catalytic domain-containing protein [Alphaproteobacteria bacterium]
MTPILSAGDRAVLAGRDGPAAAMALRIVAETARMMGAPRLIDIASVHVDGCLYHGDSGTAFVERLVADGGRVKVPTTLNVGALDLMHPDRVNFDPARRAMARRMMDAYAALGCAPTWTCAPYQAGHRPARGSDVAWGESNAIVFCNSVLGARTDRYGDFLDIAAALCGRAPYGGLHRPENRVATVLVDASALSPALRAEAALYPVLGAWLGRTVGTAIAAIEGLSGPIDEDRLKALGAAAASSGAVGLFHVVGVTPEAPDRAAAFGGNPPREIIALTGAMLRDARAGLSSAAVRGDAAIDAVAVGSPHFSLDEFAALDRLLDGRVARAPIYACTGRHVVDRLEADGRRAALEACGVILVVDTCVVVAPILPARGGLLMTNSGKFAHYTPANTGYDVAYGSLADCVASALAGRLVRDESLWS